MASPKSGSLPISKEAAAILASDPNYLKGARAVVEEYARRLRELDRLVERSEMTEERAVELGRKARKRIYARFSER